MEPQVDPTPEVATPSPLARVPARRWIHENLFPSKLDGVVTVLFGLIILYVASRVFRFIFSSAEWEIVRRNLALFMVGLFPRDELWRPWVVIGLMSVVIGFRGGATIVVRRQAAAEAGLPLMRPQRPMELLRVAWPFIALLTVLLSLSRTIQPTLLVGGTVLIAGVGRFAGLRSPLWLARRRTGVLVLAFFVAMQIILRFDGVAWDKWGGLMLTLFLALGGIVLSFPIGVLLAFGRRSSMPVVRMLSVGYIELIRGVPLVTLLFLGAFVLGFIVPPGASAPGDVTRSLIAITLFTSAYMAEIVRGGLQSVPTGQVEASIALGMSQQKTQRLIVLPQALRTVIPAIVGQFISLFKDTSLVFIVGLTDLLRVSSLATAQPDFVGQGRQAETLAFVSIVYWAIAYWMSRTSQRLERRLGIGER